MNENPDMYDTADLEALGAAVYIEQSPQENAKSFADIAEYIVQTDNFHDQRFKLYKEAMGGERFDEDIVGRVSDVVDDANNGKRQSEAYSTVWEALYHEKAADLDEADEVIEGMLEEISELDTDSGEPISIGNVNWGNQVLSEQPESNWNIGNQVILEDFDDSQVEQETQTENSEEMYDWWEEEMDTGNPDPL